MDGIRYEDIARRIADRQPACGSTKVIAVDGPSGSGKTSLADGLADVVGATLLRFDDIYPGWDGLAATPPAVVRDVLGPLAIGEAGRTPRWDWERHASGSDLIVAPATLLILDGVGSGSAIIRPFLSLLLWIDAPLALRKQRALARDGGAYSPFWDTWAAQESRHFMAENTKSYADILIDTGA